MAQDKVYMPMSSAGIIGPSSDIKIAGIQMDPKVFVIATIVFVILVKVASVITAPK